MKVYEIVFSPTGGTRQVADCVADALSEEKQLIDLSGRFIRFSDYEFSEEDLCVFAVPSFGGRVPEVCCQRISEMTGRGALAVLIAVYGNRAYDDTLLELKEVVTEQGFRCIAAIGAVAEHSIMHQYGAGRPDAADREELASFAGTIRERLLDEDKESGLDLPGRHPFREYNGLPMKPKADRSCDKCGTCAQQCPVGAIPEEDPSKTDPKLCITCMRCVAICPGNARSLNKVMVAAAAQSLKKACEVHKENVLFL